MHEAGVVSDLERLAERAEDLEHLVRWQRAAFLDDVAQARPVEVFEDEVRTTVGERAVIDRADHVRML